MINKHCKHFYIIFCESDILIYWLVVECNRNSCFLSIKWRFLLFYFATSSRIVFYLNCGRSYCGFCISLSC